VALVVSLFWIRFYPKEKQIHKPP